MVKLKFLILGLSLFLFAVLDIYTLFKFDVSCLWPVLAEYLILLWLILSFITTVSVMCIYYSMIGDFHTEIKACEIILMICSGIITLLCIISLILQGIFCSDEEIEIGLGFRYVMLSFEFTVALSTTIFTYWSVRNFKEEEKIPKLDKKKDKKKDEEDVEKANEEKESSS